MLPKRRLMGRKGWLLRGWGVIGCGLPAGQRMPSQPALGVSRATCSIASMHTTLMNGGVCFTNSMRMTGQQSNNYPSRSIKASSSPGRRGGTRQPIIAWIQLRPHRHRHRHRQYSHRHHLLHHRRRHRNLHRNWPCWGTPDARACIALRIAAGSHASGYMPSTTLLVA